MQISLGKTISKKDGFITIALLLPRVENKERRPYPALHFSSIEELQSTSGAASTAVVAAPAGVLVS